MNDRKYGFIRAKFWGLAGVKQRTVGFCGVHVSACVRSVRARAIQLAWGRAAEANSRAGQIRQVKASWASAVACALLATHGAGHRGWFFALWYRCRSGSCLRGEASTIYEVDAGRRRLGRAASTACAAWACSVGPCGVDFVKPACAASTCGRSRQARRASRRPWC